MFNNGFQGGPYVEVFSAQGKDAGSTWKHIGAGAKRDFDKEVRSYVYIVEGSSATTKIQIPKDSKQSLSLIQRYLVLQLCVPKGLDCSIDLGISDLGGVKRRLVLSTTYRDTQTNPLHSKVPLGFMIRSKWVNLCLDLIALVTDTWSGQSYKCVDSICIAGNCRLRRIFTMKLQPLDTTDDEEKLGFSRTNVVDTDHIPKHCQLPTGLPQDVQLVTMTKVRYYEEKFRGGDAVSKPSYAPPLTGRASSQHDLDLNSSGVKKGMSPENSYHIAFGTKVPSSSQPRKGSGKEGSSTSRQSKSSHSRSKSDATADSYNKSMSVTADESSQFVKPHPPREPSSEKRRRPRVKSAGKDRTPHHLSKDDSSSACSSLNSSRGTNDSRSNSGNKATRLERLSMQQPKIVANEDELEHIMRQMREISHPDHRQSETESELSSHNTSDVLETDSMDQDSLSEVIKALQCQNLNNSDTLESSCKDSVSKENALRKEDLYMFASPPKRVQTGSKKAKQSAHGGVKNHTRKRSDPNRKSQMTRRGTAESFDGGSSSECDQDTEMTPRPQPAAALMRSPPCPKKGKSPLQTMQKPRTSQIQRGTSQRSPGEHSIHHPHPAFRENGFSTISPQMAKSPHSSQTRMSINRRSLREITNDERRKSANQVPYNVEKYQPKQVAEVTDSYEARMLASMQREMMEDDTSEDEVRKQSNLQKYDTESLSSSSDEGQSTLKGASTTAAAHNYQDEMKALSQEFLSQSNPRDWGNVFSPPIAQTSLSHIQEDAIPQPISDIRPKEGESYNDELLDLLYDPVLNCYYDPVSCKYYELVS